MIKKIIAFIVLGGAVTFAGLLIIGKDYNPRSVNNEKPPKLERITAPVNENTTQKFVQQISREIIARNPQPGENLNVVKPEELIDQYLAEGVKNFNYQDLKPLVKTEDLKIVNNTGPQLAESYFSSLKKILKDNFDGLSIAPDDPYSESWDALQKAYDRASAQLYNLPVPQNLVAIHQKEISLLGAQKKIFEYIGNYKSDPLQASLAVAASQLLDKEFMTLTQEMNDFAEKNNLTKKL